VKRIRGTNKRDVLVGSDRDELIEGMGGDDYLFGGGGHDRLEGGDGDDLLFGGAGDDILNGGNGADVLTSREGADRLEAGDGNDVIIDAGMFGGTVDRLIDGGAGIDHGDLHFEAATADLHFSVAANLAGSVDVAGAEIRNIEQVRFHAGAGNDMIEGGALDDHLDGGSGDDRLVGSGGRDELAGGDGQDVLVADASDALVDGGTGIDLMLLDLGAAVGAIDYTVGTDTTLAGIAIRSIERVWLKTGAGADQIIGGDHADDIETGAGNDTVFGGEGDDVVDAGAGDDLLFGGAGDDTLRGGDGADVLTSREGADRLDAGDGNDVILWAGMFAGTSDRLVDGGAGIDHADLHFDAATADLRFAVAANLAGAVDLAGTAVSNVEQISFRAGSGNDMIEGGDLDDRIDGGSGDDRLVGSGGRDELVGGEGQDVLVADASDALVDGGAGIDLMLLDLGAAAGALSYQVGVDTTLAGISIRGIERVTLRTGAGADSLTGGDHVDDIEGGAGDDLLFGNAGNDHLLGDDGNDLIFGGIGDDVVRGGAGDDALSGNGGNDRLDGGTGADTAVYSGRRDDYEAEQLADGRIRISDLRVGAADGEDLVTGVERFAFAGGTVTLDELLRGPANRAPEAADDAFLVDADDAERSLDLLANDRDPDSGDTLTIASVATSGSLGRVLLGPDGTVSYAPGGAFVALAAGQTATDSFTYTVRDGAGLTSTATVSLTIRGVNDAPVANADTAVATASSPILLSPLANDTDPDAGDTLTLSSINLIGTRGTAMLAPGNQVRYEPGATFRSLAAGEVATDSFSYTVRDAYGALSTSTFTVEVRGVNDAPEAVGESFAVDKSVVAFLGDLLANDSDPDAGDTVTLGSVEAVSVRGAAVTLRADGTVTYDPGTIFADLAEGETATDSFSYTVVDRQGLSSTATVSLTVSGGPVIEMRVADSVFEDQATSSIGEEIDAVVQGFGPEARLVDIDTAATRGTVIFDPDTGRVTYTADHPSFDVLTTGDNFDRTTFGFVVRDGDGGLHHGVATITIFGVNDRAVAVDDHVMATEGQVLDLWSTLLANDHDAEADFLYLTSVDASGTLGRVEYDLGIGALRYHADTEELLELDEGETVVDSFTYTIADIYGEPSTATVTITVTGRAGEAPAFLATAAEGAVDTTALVAADFELASGRGAAEPLVPGLAIA
jgi:VCBS repeat-containing protein